MKSPEALKSKTIRGLLTAVVLVILSLLGIAYATTFSFTYDTDTPIGSDDPAEADDRMREIKAAVQERANVNHYWPLTGTEVSHADTGEHRFIDFQAPNSTPGAVDANKARLYTKDANSIAELHWIDENENELQITSGGALNTFTVQIVNVQDGEVATGTTIMPYDDTIPQNTEGDEYITLAITPKSATNKLKIDVVVQIASNALRVATAALFQDDTANALAAMSELMDTALQPRCIKFTHYMTAGTTLETTFKVRIGSSAEGATITLNGKGGNRYLGGVSASSITITEYKQ